MEMGGIQVGVWWVIYSFIYSIANSSVLFIYTLFNLCYWWWHCWWVVVISDHPLWPLIPWPSLTHSPIHIHCYYCIDYSPFISPGSHCPLIHSPHISICIIIVDVRWDEYIWWVGHCIVAPFIVGGDEWCDDVIPIDGSIWWWCDDVIVSLLLCIVFVSGGQVSTVAFPFPSPQAPSHFIPHLPMTPGPLLCPAPLVWWW